MDYRVGGHRRGNRQFDLGLFGLRGILIRLRRFIPRYHVVCGVTLSALCAAIVLHSSGSESANSVAVQGENDVVSQVTPVAAALEVQPLGKDERTRLTNPERIAVPRLDDAAFDAAWDAEPRNLGAVAAGRPNRGFLFNGVPLVNDGVHFRLEEPENSYGTAETVAGLSAAVNEVHRLYPGTKPLSVGHISRPSGGWLRPHKSHQNGRDVDLGFYYSDDSPWYRRATPENLDVARTWALISAMERAAGLEYVFVDRSLHDVLRRHAESVGEAADFVEYMFDGPMPVRGPIIRHARGHLTHLHVRFLSPVAVENATRVARRAGKAGRNSGQLVALLQQRDDRRSGTRTVRRAKWPARKAVRGTRLTARARVKGL